MSASEVFEKGERSPTRQAPPPKLRRSREGGSRYGDGARWFLRFTLHQRIQHIVLFSSFLLLVVTGMPLRYPYALFTKVLLFVEGGIAGRALLHRAAAVVLMGLCVYHLFYVLLSRRGHEDFLQILPTRKDLADFVNTIKHYLGLAPVPSRYGRFSYVEKFEYMAVAWGSLIMAATGLMLWFEEAAMMVFPKWALDIAKVVHSYEAVLAFLAIIIWHFYNVHLNPSVFPMSRTWLDGRISEEDMLRDHPLEYEKMQWSAAHPASSLRLRSGQAGQASGQRVGTRNSELGTTVEEGEREDN